MPWCIAGAANLPAQLDELLKASDGDITRERNREGTRALIGRDRQCTTWTRWEPARTPKEHYEAAQAEEVENRRRGFEQGLFKQTQATQAAILKTSNRMANFAVAAIVVTVLGIAASVVLPIVLPYVLPPAPVQIERPIVVVSPTPLPPTPTPPPPTPTVPPPATPDG
ncbi:MAG: hypothetical protein CL878_14705 [Dehalococcoidia bacterium]|nr:hypothetical protein [Dehalococcoidia bacterium]